MGTMFNCAGQPAYNALIATGHTRIPLLANIVFVPTTWVGCYFGLRLYGLPGAAACMLLINVVSFFLYGFYCRRDILQPKSFSLAFGFPVGMLALAVCIGFLSKAGFPAGSGLIMTVSWLGATALLFTPAACC